MVCSWICSRVSSIESSCPGVLHSILLGNVMRARRSLELDVAMRTSEKRYKASSQNSSLPRRWLTRPLRTRQPCQDLLCT